MKGLRKFILKKILWFFITLIVAVFLNFILPRLMPSDPVATITSKMAEGLTDTAAVQRIYEHYQKEFGTDKPIMVQFFIYVKNLLHGDMGTSFSQYPRSVASILSSAIGWTIALQLPAILVGWILGNFFGAVAAYKRKGWDRIFMPVSIFISNISTTFISCIKIILFHIILSRLFCFF